MRKNTGTLNKWVTLWREVSYHNQIDIPIIFIQSIQTKCWGKFNESTKVKY